jgi:hypothetical protein
MTDRREPGTIYLGMLKHLSARLCLFVYARTHRQLEYYFNINDTSLAANQCSISPVRASRVNNIIEFRPSPRVSRHR